MQWAWVSCTQLPPLHSHSQGWSLHTCTMPKAQVYRGAVEQGIKVTNERPELGSENPRFKGVAKSWLICCSLPLWLSRELGGISGGHHSISSQVRCPWHSGFTLAILFFKRKRSQAQTKGSHLLSRQSAIVFCSAYCQKAFPNFPSCQVSLSCQSLSSVLLLMARMGLKNSLFPFSFCTSRLLTPQSLL